MLWQHFLKITSEKTSAFLGLPSHSLSALLPCSTVAVRVIQPPGTHVPGRCDCIPHSFLPSAPLSCFPWITVGSPGAGPLLLLCGWGASSWAQWPQGPQGTCTPCCSPAQPSLGYSRPENCIPARHQDVVQANVMRKLRYRVIGEVSRTSFSWGYSLMPLEIWPLSW